MGNNIHNKDIDKVTPLLLPLQTTTITHPRMTSPTTSSTTTPTPSSSTTIIIPNTIRIHHRKSVFASEPRSSERRAFLQDFWTAVKLDLNQLYVALDEKTTTINVTRTMSTSSTSPLASSSSSSAASMSVSFSDALPDNVFRTLSNTSIVEGGITHAQNTASVQLEPELISNKYRYKYAHLICLLDAFTFGFPSYLLGFQVLSDNLVKICKEKYIIEAPSPTTTTTTGEKTTTLHRRDETQECDIVYTLEIDTDHTYNGRRRSTAAARRRLMTIATFIIAVIFLTWLELAIISPRNPIFLGYFAKSFAISIAYLVDAPPTAVSANFAFYFNVILAIGYIGTLLSRVSQTPLLELPNGGGLSAILPQILDAKAPFTMISYAWESKTPGSVELARSLAHALPESWIDVKWLSPGMDVLSQTVSAARTCFCLIIVLSPLYLRRPACIREFVAATMDRHESKHHTIILSPLNDPALRDIEDFLASSGFLVFRDAKKLLKFVSENISSCNSLNAKEKLVFWYQMNSEPLQVVNRNLLIPAPVVRSVNRIDRHKKKQQACCCVPGRRLFNSYRSANGAPSWMCGFYSAPPKNAIVAGTTFLSADAKVVGRSANYSVEHLYMFGLLFGASTAIGCSSVNTDTTTSAWFLCIAAAVILLSFTIPLSVFFDPRVYHSRELMPINAAAACNFAGAHDDDDNEEEEEENNASAKIGDVNTSSSSSGMSITTHTTTTHGSAKSSTSTFTLTVYVSSAIANADVDLQISNIMKFLGNFGCGLPIDRVFVDFSDGFIQHLQRKKNAHIALILIQSVKDAEDWVKHVSHKWPESQTVLLCTSSAFSEAYNRPALQRQGEGDSARKYKFSDFMSLVISETNSASSTTPENDKKNLSSTSSSCISWIPGRCTCESLMQSRRRSNTISLNPYNGLAANIIDAIGSKMAHAFCAASKNMVQQ